MLKMTRITKKYKDKLIFKQADFTARKGEIILLMGKSGSGKSTLLDMIAGVKRYDEGNYFYNDHEIFPKNDEEMSRFRNHYIGYILQDFALVDEYTTLENIILPTLYNDKRDKDFAIDKARKLAQKFEVADVLGTKVKNISGGQKQRVAISRSLILEPPIILADEPTTNLDVENFELVMAVFQKLRKEDKILIIASHDERLKSIADKIYRIENYKLISQ